MLSVDLAERVRKYGPVALVVRATGKKDIERLRAALKAAGIQESKTEPLTPRDMFGL